MTDESANLRKAARHRQKLRTAGLRPIKIVVPDTRASRFTSAMRQQCSLIAEHPETHAVLDFLAGVAVWRR